MPYIKKIKISMYIVKVELFQWFDLYFYYENGMHTTFSWIFLPFYPRKDLETGTGTFVYSSFFHRNGLGAGSLISLDFSAQTISKLVTWFVNLFTSDSVWNRARSQCRQNLCTTRLVHYFRFYCFIAFAFSPNNCS